jgi:hypothetical protein
MMKKTTLKLSRETIRTLTHDHLARVPGGVPPDYTRRCTDFCTDGCDPPPASAGCGPISTHCEPTGFAGGCTTLLVC